MREHQLNCKMDDSIKVIKSLLTTSSNGGLLVNEITKEYKEMVGKPIPYQEHGFTTLAEFLRSTNQFNGTRTASGIMVTIKIPGKSAHILKMRQNQIVSQAEKKRRRKSMMNSGFGGAISSQQPRRSIPSQVMKRSSFAISKQRTQPQRAQPQRIASYNSTAKSVAPRQTISASAQTSNTNRPPLNTMNYNTCPTEPLRKVNLHDRFVQKQITEPTVPAINSMSTTTVPQTPAPSPDKLHCKSPPQTPPHEVLSYHGKLMARLASKQVTSSDNSEKNPNDSDANTVSSDRSSLQTPTTPPVGRSCRSKLIARLQMNQSNNISEHKQKPCEALSLGKTLSRSDLYARLAPKLTESVNEPKRFGGNLQQMSIKSSTNAVHGTLNQTNKKTDISSRLQPKQIDAESSELQQISQKVRKMHVYI